MEAADGEEVESDEEGGVEAVYDETLRTAGADDDEDNVDSEWVTFCIELSICCPSSVRYAHDRSMRTGFSVQLPNSLRIHSSRSRSHVKCWTSFG